MTNKEIGDRVISLNDVLNIDFKRIILTCAKPADMICEKIKELPPVTPQQDNIAEDGTLTIRVADGRNVSRVLVCGDNHFGGLFYPDEEPQRPTGH